MQINRYPGVRPFERHERNRFFGRKEDIQGVYDLLMLEKLVVFFGKSGYGKSSLLNAGLLPRLEADFQKRPDGYLPVFVRFTDFLSNNNRSPLDAIVQQLEIVAEIVPQAAYLDAFFSAEKFEPTLWYAFKRRSGKERRRFVLLFDQFEEFFTYPESHQARFKQQLSELLYSQIPQRIRNASDDLSDADFSHLVEPMEIKALISIRGDYMQALDALKDHLPAILNKRFELKALSTEQAKEAIVEPAGLPREEFGFKTEPFVFSESALEELLAELTRTRLSSTKGIEAFQLQIICEDIENQVYAGNIPVAPEYGQPLVRQEHLPDFSTIFERYYESRLAGLPPDRLRPAHRIIENGLLFSDSVTGEARRLSVDGAFLLQQFGVEGADQDLLDLLEQSYLVRREPNSLGGYNYEISHDTLIGPVKRARQARELEDARKTFEQEQQARQAELERERRKRFRTRRIAFGMAFLALFSILAMGFAIAQYRLAYQREKEAKNMLEQFLAEKRKKDLLEVQKLLQTADSYLKADYPDLADSLVREALLIAPANLEVQQMRQRVDQALQRGRQ